MRFVSLLLLPARDDECTGRHVMHMHEESRGMRTCLVLLLAFIVLFVLVFTEAEARQCRILVVLSYHDDYVWQKEVRQGIEQVLAKKCEIVYFNLDSRNHPEGAGEKGYKAHDLFLRIKPDGVIAADDAAQIHFVVPYLRGKVDTPVVFLGVNNDASDYGYPASNVTGVVERFHIHETIALLKQLTPQVKTIAFFARANEPSTRGTFNQIRAEMEQYPLKVVGLWESDTYEEALKLAEELKGKADAIHVEQVEGIRDRNGRSYTNKELIRKISDIWGTKPLICGQTYSARYGCLCSVVESGLEQGAIASKMLLQILGGTPVSKVPITRNYTGFKVINVSVVKKLGLTPQPIVLRGAKLVTDEE